MNRGTDMFVPLMICVIAVKISSLSQPCQESLRTVVFVKSCPGSQEEWKYRAARKSCSNMPQSCVKSEEFLYHCLINEFINDTLEVCAPEAIILGQNCAEFNMHGAVIQDNPYAKCNDSVQPCPFRYSSTESYKYKKCYDYIKREVNTTRDQNNCGKSPDDDTQGVKFSEISKKDNDANDEEVGPKTPLVKDEHTNEEGKEGPSSSKPSQRPTRTKWVSSIYIGDKYCGLAYLNPNSPEDVIPVGNVERIGVLMNEKGKVEEFGDNAREKYIENCEGSDKSVFLDELEIDKKVTETGKKKMETTKIYQEMIRYLRRRIYKEISTSKDKKEEDEILHVITVPYHWHDKIENLRKVFEETLSGHDKKENLHIQLRELAISPYIHEVKASVLCLNFNVDNLTFKQHTTYANLHVGSKYCNLMFLKVEDFSKPDEILGETVQEKWDTTPENRFMDKVAEVFSAQTVKVWKEQHHSEYVSLMCQFEEQKKKMCEIMDENKTFEFSLSVKLKELHDLSLKDIEKSAKRIRGLELKK
ncbi:uncharacterized protein LOC133192995 [Saccostrea echinata]|uniref:uncharacterized protein LOC133192995 n=1 Tax=Saccostrea echinata TaxID=191078 RepID=UPI002A829C28|nr:uncharacterized protein LOC133192995 [Saccostrea echinata]